MSSYNPIGGFLGLELRAGGRHHDGEILLNSGRSCFEYIIRVTKPLHVYISKYTCDAMLEPLKKLEVPYSFYTIDNKLELSNVPSLREGELLVYTNYFGLKDKYSTKLAGQYKEQLVLDCSQAYYFPPSKNGFTFYSYRKFFGVADGGLLYSPIRLDCEIPIDMSYHRMGHLLKRIDLGPVEAYEDFIHNEEALSKEPIKHMSKLTTRIIDNIDFEGVRISRNENYNILHKSLGQSNILNLETVDPNGPLCYPFLTSDKMLRQRLIERQIFVPTYWHNVLNWAKDDEIEYELAQNLLPLPIDQRYGSEHMERIIELINE